MANRTYHRLLLVSFCFVLFFFTLARCDPAPEADTSSDDEDVTSSPVSSPESDAPEPSSEEDEDSLLGDDDDDDSRLPSESESPVEAPAETDLITSFDDPSSILDSPDFDPELKKICNSTDYAALCIVTVSHFMKPGTKPDPKSVLEAAIEAGYTVASQAYSAIKKLKKAPDTPEDVATTVADCRSGYSRAVENYEKAKTSLTQDDTSRMTSMLSATITIVGDCQESLATTDLSAPLDPKKPESVFVHYADKLTNVTSNCLAIASLIN